jgi:hypothetical protein
LKYSRELDTELQVNNWCRRHYASQTSDLTEAWLNWSKIKGTFKPKSVPEWISDFALKACGRWGNSIEHSGRKGIIWTEHRAFGARLAEVIDRPYFGAGDSSILDTKEPVIVASIAAHGEGKNLQRFSENLVTAPPTSGKVWEQLGGRTHRAGQEADEVNFEIFLHAEELRASFDQARADAVYLEDTTGGRQKLNYAQIVV